MFKQWRTALINIRRTQEIQGNPLACHKALEIIYLILRGNLYSKCCFHEQVKKLNNKTLLFIAKTLSQIASQHFWIFFMSIDFSTTYLEQITIHRGWLFLYVPCRCRGHSHAENDGLARRWILFPIVFESKQRKIKKIPWPIET